MKRKSCLLWALCRTVDTKSEGLPNHSRTLREGEQQLEDILSGLGHGVRAENQETEPRIYIGNFGNILEI